MLEEGLGKKQALAVVKKTEFGVYLGTEEERVLLPRKQVPEGTQVLIPLYAMQHRADIWGADVEEFRPERWETYRPGWEFIPFGAGARKCLGRKYLSPLYLFCEH